MALSSVPRPSALLPVATTDDLLRELIAEVRGLRDDLRRPASSSLSREDRAILGRLLPVLGATFGSEIWTAREAVDHQSVDLRLVLAGLSAKALGRLCKRAGNVPIAGLCITAEGEEAGATLWCVKRTL